jgi:hypothetical protein
MTTSDALYEYVKSEVVPMIAKDSEFVGGLLNGALRTSRKKLAAKLSDNSMLQAIGLVQENGEINADTFREFADGMFDGKDCIPLSLAELLKLMTGIESDSDLLKSRLKLTRADADKLLELLQR